MYLELDIILFRVKRGILRNYDLRERNLKGDKEKVWICTSILKLLFVLHPEFVSIRGLNFHGNLFLSLFVEKARLQAEAKAAEEARRKAEAEAAAEAKRKRELEREAARQALQQVWLHTICVADAGCILLFLPPNLK